MYFGIFLCFSVTLIIGKAFLQMVMIVYLMSQIWFQECELPMYCWMCILCGHGTLRINCFFFVLHNIWSYMNDILALAQIGFVTNWPSCLIRVGLVLSTIHGIMLDTGIKQWPDTSKSTTKPNNLSRQFIRYWTLTIWMTWRSSRVTSQLQYHYMETSVTRKIFVIWYDSINIGECEFMYYMVWIIGMSI